MTNDLRNKSQAERPSDFETPNPKETNPISRTVGRPCVHANAEQVRDLRDNQGLSLRQIARILGIGKTTVARLYYAAFASEVSLNPEAGSLNLRFDVCADQHGTQPAQPSGERQHAG